MNPGESTINDSISVLLDCLAVFSMEVAKLIESDNLKYIDRRKLAEDMRYVSEQLIDIRSNIDKFNKRQKALGIIYFSEKQGTWPLSNS
ncbi:MAG: hypothetical protein ABSB95_03895 [Dissulfurispiraceae bacterium]|jgi:hypothetical protein